MTSRVDICYIIPDLLSTTPRAKKFIRTLLSMGYSVHLICCNRRKFAYNQHNDIVKEFKKTGKFTTNELDYNSLLLSRLINKILSKTLTIFPKIAYKLPDYLIAFLYDPIFLQLQESAKRTDAQIYMGSRGVTLPILHYYNLRNKISILDIEDQYCQESNDVIYNEIAKKFLNGYSASMYLTSSILQAESFFNDIGEKGRKALEILNAPDWHQRESYVNTNEIKMIWFSQHVKLERGLSIFLQNLKSQKTIHLSLIGDVDVATRNFIIDEYSSQKLSIEFRNFLKEEELMIELKKADIGLAIDNFEINKSRHLAVPNKLTYYLVMGLYVLYSTTEGHQYIMNKYKNAGEELSPDYSNLPEIIDNLSIENIRENREARVQSAKQLHWKYQSVPFKNLMQSLPINA